MLQPSLDCRFKLSKSTHQARCCRTDGQHALVSALYGSPNGVEKMSDAVPGLVETSTNLGILSVADGTLTAGHLTRSAVDSERDDLAQMVQSVFELAGTDAVPHGAYSGWPPNPDSPIVKLMQSEYQTLFGEEAAVEAIHAGLETSVIGAKYPEMDMISVGPTLQSVHSPDERMEVSTVEHTVSTAGGYLADIPAQKSSSTAVHHQAHTPLVGTAATTKKQRRPSCEGWRCQVSESWCERASA